MSGLRKCFNELNFKTLNIDACTFFIYKLYLRDQAMQDKYICWAEHCFLKAHLQDLNSYFVGCTVVCLFHFFILMQHTIIL